jgi:hypothetical protein
MRLGEKWLRVTGTLDRLHRAATGAEEMIERSGVPQIPDATEDQQLRGRESTATTAPSPCHSFPPWIPTPSMVTVSLPESRLAVIRPDSFGTVKGHAPVSVRPHHHARLEVVVVQLPARASIPYL